MSNLTERSVILTAQGVDVGHRRGRQRKVVLSGINVALHAGELACLVGVNGSGKSTLLRTLTGLQEPLSGTVRFDDDVSVTSLARAERARRVAIVSTERVVVGQLRAYDLVALGRYPHTGWSGRLGPADHDIVRESLHRAGAAPLADRPMTELSDGERQRVMVARALAQEPALLILDEPTAFLDVRARMELVVLLLELTATAGLAVLLSTHELELMLRHAHTIWLATDGNLIVGEPEELALDGTVERAFEGRSGYRFDPGTMTFHIESEADLQNRRGAGG